MNLKFSQLIDEVQAAISKKYLSNAIAWIDENKSNAWTLATDRFEEALIKAIQIQDFSLAKREGDIYRTTMLDLFEEYKLNNNIQAEADGFLDSLTHRETLEPDLAIKRDAFEALAVKPDCKVCGEKIPYWAYAEEKICSLKCRELWANEHEDVFKQVDQEYVDQFKPLTDESRTKLEAIKKKFNIPDWSPATILVI